MPSIERFHCIQDSQLGPSGVHYRAVFTTMQPMRLNATQSTVLKNTYLHLHFTPRQIWNLDCADIIYIHKIGYGSLYSAILIYVLQTHMYKRILDNFYFRFTRHTYITVPVLLIHTYCVCMSVRTYVCAWFSVSPLTSCLPFWSPPGANCARKYTTSFT